MKNPWATERIEELLGELRQQANNGPYIEPGTFLDLIDVLQAVNCEHFFVKRPENIIRCVYCGLEYENSASPPERKKLNPVLIPDLGQ